MTVIAWDGRTLASDRLVLYGSMSRVAEKIFIYGDIAYGAAGTYDQVLVFRQWVALGMPDPIPVLDDLAVIEIELWECYVRDGEHLGVRSKIVGRAECGGIWAIGCGRELAMGAMLAGKGAREAVRIACLQDSHCGCLGLEPDAYDLTGLRT